MLVSLISRLVACSARIVVDRQTRRPRTRTRKERLSQAQARTKWPLATWSRFIRMRVFSGVKNGRPIVPTGNALASQRSIFRESRLKFRPSSAAEKVSIVCTNNHVKSEMLSNRHTHRPSTVTLAAHARRGLIHRESDLRLLFFDY